MFLGLPDQDPDPLVRGACGSGSGSIYHPSIIKQNSKKNLEFYCFVAYFILFSLKKNVPSKSNKQIRIRI
jgi:hypothetical protein